MSARAAAVAALALLASACASKPEQIPPAVYDPPLLVCASRCWQPCDTSVPRWAPANPASPEAWDLIRPQVVDPLAAKLLVCEEHRASCVECMAEAERQGIIVSQGR